MSSVISLENRFIRIALFYNFKHYSYIYTDVVIFLELNLFYLVIMTVKDTKQTIHAIFPDTGLEFALFF